MDMSVIDGRDGTQLVAKHKEQSQPSTGKVSRRIKVADRFGWQCYWCGQALRQEIGYKNTATMEHITPRSLGGSNGMRNLAASCHRCNYDRGIRPAEEFAKQAQGFEPDTRKIQDVINAVKLQRQIAHQERMDYHRLHKLRQQVLQDSVSRASREDTAVVAYTPTASERFLGKIANVFNWFQTKIVQYAQVWAWAL